MNLTDEPEISVIVPALNEADNLAPLVEQIDAALKNHSHEILIVDDNSRDATPAVCAALAGKYPVRLLVRTQPTGGLGGAVLHGFSEARGNFFVVMDADLQHPPEKLPEILAPLLAGQSDFVLGSRHVPGGSVGQQWGWFRRINSSIATFLARPFAGRARDPMSGFFALSRETFNRGSRLAPLGYKIGLELMCKCRVRNIREVPIHFAERARGESKLSLREQFRYLEHLSRLYDFCYPRLSPITKFLIVTSLAWLLGLGTFLTSLRFGIAWPGAILIAYAFGILLTAIFHRRYIRAQREFLLARFPSGEFFLISAAELIVCAAAAHMSIQRMRGLDAWELFFIAFAAGTLTRYILRKELMHDIRGLRQDPRRGEIT